MFMLFLLLKDIGIESRVHSFFGPFVVIPIGLAFGRSNCPLSSESVALSPKMTLIS